MKKIIILVLILSFFVKLSYWETNNCSYQSEISECLEVRKNWNPWSITEFICPQSVNNEQAIYQIILDKKFKEIDKIEEKYLADLEKNKDNCFWPDRKSLYISCIDDIDARYNIYWSKWWDYTKFCNPSYEESVVKEAMSCNDWATVNWVLSYFPQSDCEKLVEYKLFMFKQVAYGVLKQNKVQVLKDYRKKQFQWTRTKYSNVVDNMVQSLDAITRINSMRNVKTKHPYPN